MKDYRMAISWLAWKMGMNIQKNSDSMISDAGFVPDSTSGRTHTQIFPRLSSSTASKYPEDPDLAKGGIYLDLRPLSSLSKDDPFQVDPWEIKLSSTHTYVKPDDIV